MRILKIALLVVGGLLVCVAGLLLYVKFVLPRVGAPPAMSIDRTPARVERGRYLAVHVAGCIACHSERDWSHVFGPLAPGTEGKGGELFGREQGFPGQYYASNITPAGIGSWTDGELYRAITTGVSRDGHALFPIMPYEALGKADPEDVKAIIAYIRTLAPVANAVPASTSDFPMNFIINTIPSAAQPQSTPDRHDEAAYGKYLVSLGSCIDCHTKKTDKGDLIAGMEFAGGAEFKMPEGTCRSSNITPDSATGIGKWSRDFFLARCTACADSASDPAPVREGQVNSVMPWTFIAGMTREDLGAIYAYLRTLPAVHDSVERFTHK